ncbi:undecaprenyl-phosphate glucose phosphotransferase [Synechococcus sp. Minos11]|uniref:sugar transferase n=1 Tax=Synechococcus sp. Minos11 TaxID=221341 RepID=UPI00164434EA|nr:sugar transferase [Synechococcus sp. Minos11]QNJ07666.1 undecaprenyl-phosphate glucose phosphotransferase [Synechococcus sp. Minos11]
MTLRAPWLRERLLLLSLALWDLVVVCAMYGFIYRFRLGQAPGVTLALTILVLFWLGGSYLLGRYTQRRRGWASWQPTAQLALLVLAIFVAQAWLVGIADSGTRLRSFLLPLLCGIAAGSGLGHQVLAAFRPEWEAVVLLCTTAERPILKAELATLPAKIHQQITFVDEDEDPGVLTQFSRRSLIVAISDQARIPDAHLERFITLRPLGVRVGSLVDWAERSLQRVPPELLSERWLLAADGFSLQPGRWSWRVKRFFDVLGAISLLLITSPLVLIAGLAIWLEDRGPILYSQIRSGLYGDPVRIWKLRSMRVDAEVNGMQWAQIQDPRITRCGGWLRRLRIDELPQLWAVLRGDLSLIGPRPERPELELELEQSIPHYRVRHWIRPGLSGWAQVNYPYGNSVADSRIKLSYDLYYLRNAGILLDLLILVKTIRLVLRAQGAQPQQ